MSQQTRSRQIWCKTRSTEYRKTALPAITPQKGSQRSSRSESPAGSLPRGATTKALSNYLNFFKGKVVDSDIEAVNGDRDDKHLIFVRQQRLISFNIKTIKSHNTV